MKETVIPSGANRARLYRRADADLDPGAGRLGGDPVRRRRRRRQHQCRHPLSVRDQLAVGLRHHHGRLGVELALCVSRRAALGGADGVVRGLDRLCAGHRAAVRRVAEPERHRAGATPRLVCDPAAADGGDLLHLRPGRDQPRAVRPAGRRIGAGRRLFRRIFGDDLRAVLLGEYGNMILVSAMTTILFLGGWLAPFGIRAVRRWACLGAGLVLCSRSFFVMF